MVLDNSDTFNQFKQGLKLNNIRIIDEDQLKEIFNTEKLRSPC